MSKFLEFVMPYGRHAGESFNVIPSDYLRWVAAEFVCHPQKHVLAVHAANALAKREAVLDAHVFLAELAAHRCDPSLVALYERDCATSELPRLSAAA